MSLQLNGTAGVTYNDGSNQPAAASPYVLKNRIINGNFDIWQRGTSFSVTASTNIYTADRWRFVGSGFTGTLTRQNFTAGQTDVPNNPDYFARWDVTTNPSANIAFGQLIENVQTLAGKTATVSFYFKSNATIAANTLQFRYRQVTGGTGGTNNSVNIGEITTSWQKFTFTVNIPSLSGATLGASNSSYLAFEILSGSSHSSAFQLDIAQCQLEEGDTATPFENRMYSQELAMCQRYYFKHTGVAVGDRFAVGMGDTTSNINTIFALPTNMRATPSTSYDLINLRNGATDKTISSVFAIRLFNNSVNLIFAVSDTATTGAVYMVRGTTSSGAYIDFSAEL